MEQEFPVVMANDSQEIGTEIVADSYEHLELFFTDYGERVLPD